MAKRKKRSTTGKFKTGDVIVCPMRKSMGRYSYTLVFDDGVTYPLRHHYEYEQNTANNCFFDDREYVLYTSSMREMSDEV